jgi:hypothetical protein
MQIGGIPVLLNAVHEFERLVLHRDLSSLRQGFISAGLRCPAAFRKTPPDIEGRLSGADIDRLLSTPGDRDDICRHRGVRGGLHAHAVETRRFPPTF